MSAVERVQTARTITSVYEAGIAAMPISSSGKPCAVTREFSRPGMTCEFSPALLFDLFLYPCKEAYYCLMIVLMWRLEWLGATARQVGQDRRFAGLKANHRSATRCRLDIGKFFQKSRLSPAAHEEFITKGCQMVMARPSPYSPASVLTRQVLSFRPDIGPGRTVLARAVQAK